MHWRGQSPETSPYDPQLAHSTRLPKTPGYNLEWSRVTPIQDTLVTGPPAKALHHEHHLKRCRKPFLAHHYWTKIAWRASNAARRSLVPNRLAGITYCQAPSASRILTAPSPPGGLYPAARRLVVRHACWTTSGQVHKVGLRAGRSVELDHERVGSWEHDNP